MCVCVCVCVCVRETKRDEEGRLCFWTNKHFTNPVCASGSPNRTGNSPGTIFRTCNTDKPDLVKQPTSGSVYRLSRSDRNPVLSRSARSLLRRGGGARPSKVQRASWLRRSVRCGCNEHSAFSPLQWPATSGPHPQAALGYLPSNKFSSSSQPVWPSGKASGSVVSGRTSVRYRFGGSPFSSKHSSGAV